MAEVALSWSGPDGFDDASMSFASVTVDAIAGFDDADAYVHPHSGSVDLIIYLRRTSDQTWIEVYRLTTSSSVTMNTLLNIKFPKITTDGIRFLVTPAQGTATHAWAGLSIRLNEAAAAAGGGGGGGGGGTGNMVGAFVVGSTMLGAEPGGGGGGGGGSGTGNMVGGFVVGQTMLGGEPGGGGSDVPLAPGSPQPLEATLSGQSTVAGAFATFIWEVAGKPTGVAALLSPYLSAPWTLGGSTVNATGITQYRTGWTFVTAPTAGERNQVVSYEITTTTSHGATAYFYRKSDDKFVTTSGYSAGTSGQNFKWTFDAGADNYVGRIEVNSSGRVLLWETFPEPISHVRALLHSPIAMFADTVGEATVTADVSQHVLRSERIDGVASGSGSLSLAQPLQSTVVAGNSVASGTMGILVPAEAAVVSDSTVEANLDQYISPATANGSAEVTGEATHSVLSGHMSGGGEVVAGLATDASVQGGDSHGTSTVVGHATHFAQVSGTAEGATVRLLANLGKEAYLSGGTSVGDSTVVSDAIITILDARGNGGAAGEATVVGHFIYAGGGPRLQAAVQGEATVVGDYRGRIRLSPQAIVGTSTVTCPALIRVWWSEGRPAGEATVAPLDLVVHTIPPGPITGEATVVGHATHDARYGGEIEGEAEVRKATVSVVLEPFPKGFTTSNGDASVKGRLYVRPQDFDASTSDGTAAVLGQILLIDLALGGKSVGGRHHKLTQDGKFTEPPQYDDTLAKAYLAAKAPFAPVRINGYAEFERAILLLNDSGLISGNARAEAFLDFKTGVGDGIAKGYSINRGQFNFARDLSGTVTDAWAGVGKWFKDGFTRIYHYDYSLTMAPIKDINPYTGEDHTGLPGNAVWHGASLTEYHGVSYARHATIDSRINGHIWDGTYEDWFWGVDVKGLDIRNFPELWDPDKPGKQPYDKYPGPLRRKYQLLQPGEAGTWMVDTRGPGFLDKAMRADPVGEARFDEPHSTVDMDLELKSSMKGRIVCHADVVAVALILSFRSLIQEGNVTALRHLTTLLSGNAAKSPEALLPMTRENVDLLNPVRQSNAMYV